MKEPKEIYFLPVEQLSDDAIQCIEKVFELLDAIKDDCNINNFSRRFTFIREGKAISDVAEIKKDSDGLNHIYISTKTFASIYGRFVSILLLILRMLYIFQ